MTTAEWKYKVENEDDIGKLASYYAGHRAILELLAEYKEKQGDDFSWKTFNGCLVTAGSPPFFALRMRMLGAE